MKLIKNLTCFSAAVVVASLSAPMDVSQASTFKDD